MKMNAGGWIGIIGGILGFTVGLVAVLTTTGSAGIYIAAGMIAVFGGMFVLFYKLFFAPMILEARLKKTGIAGKALIKEVHDTGVTINNSPQVKLVLEVKNYLGQTYTTTLRTLVSRLNPALYQPGMTVPVKIDPNNEQVLIIDFSADDATVSTPQPRQAHIDTDALTKKMLDEQQVGDSIRLSGKSARAIVRSFTSLGINVNGNNPYVELEIEVLPDGAAAFSAKVRGAIQELSVPKYQPGQEIYVKYDPADLTRVSMDHS